MLNIDKLCEVQKVFKEQYELFEGLCGISENHIHLTEDAFMSLCEKNGLDFDLVEHDRYKWNGVTEYNGVKIIALCKK